MEQIVLGGGCFWCTEAVFNSLIGVESVVSGYAGGSAHDANYTDVCAGHTQHVEVIEVSYQPSLISARQLLEVFFATHDPTQLNRQGNDVGTQYASVVFYRSSEQQQAALELIKQLEEDGLNIKTRVEEAPEFYPAEDYHQNFYAKNPSQGYCNAVIPPKLSKLSAGFSKLIKR